MKRGLRATLVARWSFFPVGWNGGGLRLVPQRPLPLLSLLNTHINARTYEPAAADEFLRGDTLQERYRLGVLFLWKGNGGRGRRGME